LLSSTGRLDAQLEALRQQAPEIDKANWTALAQVEPGGGALLAGVVPVAIAL
jgi:hypothetical protein